MAATAPTTPGPAQLVERVQDLQARLEATGDSAVRDVADELVSAVVQMYGAGLERIMAGLFDAGEDGERIAAALSGDELVATLLLIHDLHPVDLGDRVQQALDSVRPYMESHGGNVELLSLTDGVARIHLQGSCSDCSASSVTLELAIKAALEEAAPDLEGLEVVGVAAQTAGGPGLPMVTGTATPPPPTGLELPVVMSGPVAGAPPQVAGAAPQVAEAAPHPPSAAMAPPAWFDVDGAADLSDGALTAFIVAGSELVVANVDGTLLAYRDRCAGCGGALHGGLLSAGALACPSCQRSFFLPRAGRSMDDDHVQLEPVPLLRDQGRVKVALTQ
jgi:Fe-S cluster biogenesis protein NfuA/nitrite reductase/ring-hydroxylating ferredoxin subunit